jgi:FAD/FMN-containing dehydrogenase
MHYPENTRQVEAIIQNARKIKTPLVARSSRGPHLHGASENPIAETVDFSCMNRIIKIDRRSRYVRVEPGVTFGELIPLLKDAGMRLNMPLLPRAGKSVVASALEREAVLIPKYQYDYTDPLLTVEAVFGTGDVFRTGSAAGPGSPEETRADMVLPWGPGCVDYLRFFTGAQGTMGFVTWATLKTEVLPSLSKLYFVQAASAEKLTCLANTLLRRRIPDECVILSRVSFAAAFAEDAAEEDKLLSTLAPWVMLCRICGFERYPEERLSIYEGYLKEVCAEAGLEAVPEVSALPGLADKVETKITDCDWRKTYWKLRRGGVREIDMLCPPSRAPRLITLLENLSCPGAVGITVQPQVLGRAFRIECSVFFSGDPTETEQVEKALEDVSRQLFEAGAYFDRPYGKLSKIAFESDPVSTEAIRKLKRICDPDGILNPGKLCF